MTTQQFPELNPDVFATTRDALHAYAKVLGAWASKCRTKRKHWWHASLRPSLDGLSTGVIYAGIDFQIDLNLADSELRLTTAGGKQLTERLRGQPAAELALAIEAFLLAAGIDTHDVPERVSEAAGPFNAYSPEQASLLGLVLNTVAANMQLFRAGIREETSPVQIWPHHFDLSMLWLPGDKIPDQDPADEENADKQMNFGFTFGDDGIPEPYFYGTAYPLPDALSAMDLPAGSEWRTDGFSGAVLLYRQLLSESDPAAYLQGLWKALLSAGRRHLPDTS